MKLRWSQRSRQASRSAGFSAVELVLASVIFPIIVVGLANTYNSLRHSYMTARQLNEVYAVLSACPEIDRALEYTSLTSSTNCYPNNVFNVENSTTGGHITYSPTLTVTDTSALTTGDPLKSVPDSKLINIQVGLPAPSKANLPLRILITRNGIGQL